MNEPRNVIAGGLVALGSLLLICLLAGCGAHSPRQDRSAAPAPWGPPASEAAPGSAPRLGDVPVVGGLFRGNASGNEDGEVARRLARAGVSEVWVIEKSDAPTAEEADFRPDLIARDPATKKLIPVPLKHTTVDGKVTGYIAEVDVVQQFENPFDTKIEAVYVFPLPQNAAVTDFLMTIGDRTIRGMIREREEAEAAYREARAQGYTAALLTQERPNIFTQKVANIEPGKRIDITMTYFNTLTYADGLYEFVFPMVVGPRFNPPDARRPVVPAARGGGAAQAENWDNLDALKAVVTEFLAPDERSGHDIELALTIDAGLPIQSIDSENHVIRKEQPSPTTARITLSPNDRVPNRDFILRYKLDGDKLQTAFVTHRGEHGNTFALMLQPPADVSSIPRRPREMIFVVDCSGSMHGKPLAKAKEAMRRCLKHLNRDDTFQIIRFSSNASQLGRRPLPATRTNVDRGLRYVDQLNSGGGTMMIEGIKAALDFPHSEKRLRVVSFMTDGYIGNEAEILATIAAKLGDTRIFSFGVGNSVNRYLLESMAKVGRGAVAYVGLDRSAGKAVDRFYERIAHPALTDVEFDWGELKVTDVFPREVPDVFVGRPALVTGRFTGDIPDQVTLHGRCGDRAITMRVDLRRAGTLATHPGIQFVWARQKLGELALREDTRTDVSMKDEMTAFSIEQRVMCRYTAYLAIDSGRRTEGDHGVRVHVPVPVPDGVRYETTVPGAAVGSKRRSGS